MGRGETCEEWGEVSPAAEPELGSSELLTEVYCLMTSSVQVRSGGTQWERLQVRALMCLQGTGAVWLAGGGIEQGALSEVGRKVSVGLG